MIGDPRDRSAYGIALATLGLALAVLLAGICWIATQRGDITVSHERGCALEAPHHCRPASWSTAIDKSPEIPRELWVALAALGGVFVGALVPYPLPARGLSPYDVEINWLRRLGNLAIFAVPIAALIAAIVIVTKTDALPGYAAAGFLLGIAIPSPANSE